MTFSKGVCVSFRELAWLRCDLFLLSMGNSQQVALSPHYPKCFHSTAPSQARGDRHTSPILGLPWLLKLCLTIAKTAMFHVSGAVCISGPHASPAPHCIQLRLIIFLEDYQFTALPPHTLKKKKQEIHSVWSYWQKKQIMGPGDPSVSLWGLLVCTVGLNGERVGEDAGKCGLLDTTWLMHPGLPPVTFKSRIILLFWDRVSICNPCWPPTLDPPVSVSQVLGSQAVSADQETSVLNFQYV